MRVVSMPCWELFAAEEESYQQSVLPSKVACLAVEAASSFGWDRYADATVSIDHFGSSGAGSKNMEAFGFSATNVAARARELLASEKRGDS